MKAFTRDEASKSRGLSNPADRQEREEGECEESAEGWEKGRRVMITEAGEKRKQMRGRGEVRLRRARRIAESESEEDDVL